MEIERKFKIKSLPSNLESYANQKMIQGYLCTSPVVRIRRSNDEFYLTYKGSGMMAREEYNLPLTEEAFYHLLPKADGIIIEKTRYLIPIDENLTAELDIFEGAHKSLIIVEVEFSSIEEANSFVPPDWFGEDVTNSILYHNSYLSTHPIN